MNRVGVRECGLGRWVKGSSGGRKEVRVGGKGRAGGLKVGRKNGGWGGIMEGGAGGKKVGQKNGGWGGRKEGGAEEWRVGREEGEW